jgi:hypothetical protein
MNQPFRRMIEWADGLTVHACLRRTEIDACIPIEIPASESWAV